MILLILAPFTTKDIGIVSNCTLPNAKHLKNLPHVTLKRKYCAVYQGYKTQPQALAHCKALNARLPLPKSDAESFVFTRLYLNLRHTLTWIDITDPGSGPRFLIFFKEYLFQIDSVSLFKFKW